jgi:hypothetical protein
VERQLTDFQVQCEKRLISALCKIGLSIAGRSLDGEMKTYITNTVSGTNVTFWIYEDGADIKSPNGNPVFEKPDYDSLDELGKAFVNSIMNSIE